MFKRFLFLATFVLLLGLAHNSYGDTTAPRPTPMKWLTVPATTGPTSITMTAVTALDAGNDYPVEYLFECTNHSEANSTWQSSPTYEAAGLTPGTVYTFKARARDSAGNMTGWTSNILSTTTDADTTPPVLRLDLNNTINNDEPNTQAGFFPLSIATTGSEVNGISVDLGGNISSARREDPVGGWTKYGGTPTLPGDPCYYGPRAGERIYRDFIYGTNQSGVTITLWGLGVGRDCNITIWAYDNQAAENRTANWYANGTHILDTNFIGGSTSLPLYDNYPGGAADLYKYAFKGRGTSDEFGRITLTSSKAPYSSADQPFAFVNAIKVEPNVLSPFVPTRYAYHPLPVNGANDVPANVTLEWKQGGYAEKHDLYFGTDYNDVNNASRGDPLGVLISENQSATTYVPPEFLELNTTYYWRIDEVNAAPDYTIFKGAVYSFQTLPYFVVDNFNSYEDNSALRNVWKNGSTSAEVSVETALVRDGRSMKYWYKNDIWPYYSEADADISDLGIDDPNWLGMGAKSLSLWFYGQAGNDVNQPMYVRLTDGDASPHTAQVNYDGDMNNISVGVYQEWHEWSMNLQDFVDNNNVNLANVKTITIGFGDGTEAAGDGIVCFEDIRLYKSKRICPTVAVTGDLNGDCAVDYLDLKILTDNWLADCTEPENCRGADFEPDGDVDLFDFSDLAMQWQWWDNPCSEGWSIPLMPSFSSLPSNPYYPDPFRFMSGSRMTKKDQWICRRAEIAEQIQEYELGYMQDTPYSATTGSYGSNSITVTVNDNGHQISFACSISYPTTGSPPYPAIIGVGGSSLNNTVLRSLGVAIITFPNFSIAGSSRGSGLFYNMYGSDHSAGSMMAWAWGVSRLIDAIEKTPEANIDPNRLGVTGCSRNGKGALVCGAFNDRIKLTIPQESGTGGCAGWRTVQSEGGCQTMESAVTEDVWFRASFDQFINVAEKLPFDHHMLASMCAPNALLFIENTSQGWLCAISCWTNGNISHKTWEALGIPDKMGFSQVGGHDHCVFPSSQQPDVTAYVQKFQVGGGTADTNIIYTDGGFPFDEARWVNWTVPNLE